MSKKGFTLVELLAVIAILAILVIIAMPNVLEMFNKAKQDAFETEVTTIIKTVEKQWLSDSIGGNKKDSAYCRVNGTDCKNALKMDGNTELDYYVKVNSQGKITELGTTNGEYQYVNVNSLSKSSDDINSEIISELDPSKVISITKYGIVMGGKPVSNGGSTVISIKTGEVLDELDLCAFDIDDVTLNIEPGVIINKILIKENNTCKEITLDELYKLVLPKNVSSINEIKTAITDGYRNLVLTETLNISGSQSITAPSKTKISTNNKITVFNITSGNSLTLENIVLDGKNKYKVDISKGKNAPAVPFNETGHTNVYINVPLIKTAGTLNLKTGTTIKDYANQAAVGSQYGAPAISSTGGTITINGLEFTNNVSQLLVASNTNVTINDINVHNTWTIANKGGLIEINTGSKMDVNGGTFKNNLMTMRSYGLFIAASGTINMKGGTYENNISTKNGSNTAGSLFGVEGTGKIYMTGGSIINNVGYRAGSFATRWTSAGSIIEINGGTIKNNTTISADFKNAGIFVQSDVKFGQNAVIEDKVVLRSAAAVLNNYGTIKGDVELVDTNGTFNNHGTVTGQIIRPN